MNTYTGIPASGQGRARVLGFPTINIPLSEEVSGIYAAKVSFGGNTYHAVVFADSVRHVLEAHIVEPFSEEVTDEVTVVLEKKIRDTYTFPNDTALIEAIEDDVRAAKAHFNV